VVASALRLAARGHDALGTVVRARELRERLSGEKVWELLADLDAAWAAGAPLEAPLKALEQGPSPHFLPRRISEEPLEARVRGILREYPYSHAAADVDPIPTSPRRIHGAAPHQVPTCVEAVRAPSAAGPADGSDRPSRSHQVGGGCPWMSPGSRCWPSGIPW